MIHVDKKYGKSQFIAIHISQTDHVSNHEVMAFQSRLFFLELCLIVENPVPQYNYSSTGKFHLYLGSSRQKQRAF